MSFYISCVIKPTQGYNTPRSVSIKWFRWEMARRVFDWAECGNFSDCFPPWITHLSWFVCLFLWWAGVGPITEYSCDKPVPVFLSAMAKKQTPPIDRPWCYHTGASLNGKPDWKPPISMHVLYWPFHKVKGRKNLFPIPCFRASQHRDWVMACQTNYPLSRTLISNRLRIIEAGEPQQLTVLISF